MTTLPPERLGKLETRNSIRVRTILQHAILPRLTLIGKRRRRPGDVGRANSRLADFSAVLGGLTNGYERSHRRSHGRKCTTPPLGPQYVPVTGEHALGVAEPGSVRASSWVRKYLSNWTSSTPGTPRTTENTNITEWLPLPYRQSFPDSSHARPPRAGTDRPVRRSHASSILLCVMNVWESQREGTTRRLIVSRSQLTDACGLRHVACCTASRTARGLLQAWQRMRVGAWSWAGQDGGLGRVAKQENGGGGRHGEVRAPFPSL